MGVRRGNISISVQHFPDKKKPCLMVIRDNIGVKIGTLIDKENEELFNEALEYLAFGDMASKEACEAYFRRLQ